MNDFAAPHDPLGHDIGHSIQRALETQTEAPTFSDTALSVPVALRGLESRALEELQQLRATKPVRTPAVPTDPVASYIEWDLAVDGLRLARQQDAERTPSAA